MNGSADCRDIRHALGVYVLGAIDPAERTMVDAHLSTCPECREELAGLAGLPALLRRIPVGEAQQLAEDDLDAARCWPARAEVPSEEMLRSLLARTTRVRQARRWRGLAAAAAVVLVAGAAGAAGWSALHHAAGGGGGSAMPAHFTSATATNPATHVARDRPVRGQGLGHGPGHAGEERSRRGPLPARGHRLQRAHHGRRRLDDHLRRGFRRGIPARPRSRWTACAASRSPRRARPWSPSWPTDGG